MDKISADQIEFLNELVIGKKISKKETNEVIKRITSKQLTPSQYYLELAFSAGFLRNSTENIMEQHLYYLHWARIKAISTLVPKADIIVDLGGANGSLYDMGYPHKFEKITVVDLLPEDRIDMYKNIDLKEIKTPNGVIDIHFGDMSDLSFIKDKSVDLVWSGESIEHVDIKTGIKTLKEALRVLKPGGYLCLDTPNRTVTKIHTAWRGGDFIHPEHKVEYHPHEIQKLLKHEGFEIVESWGICEMNETVRTNNFIYEELVSGLQLVKNPENSYMQYYTCRKPLSRKTILKSKIKKLKRK
jgi:predicted SAM-dependent methyltransferase